MVQDGVSDDDDPLAGAMHAPAEVQVIAKQRQLRIEAVEPLPHITPDQHAGRAHRQHVTDAIVLALIVLPTLQAGEAPPGSGDAEAGLEQEPLVVPAQDLGAQDRHIGLVVCGIEQCR